MPHLALSFELGALPAAVAERACFAAGAVAVTLQSGRGPPVLEPARGQIRLWKCTRMEALFPSDRAGPVLIADLAAALGLKAAQLKARALEDRLWEREWLRDFRPRRFGTRLWVCPRHAVVRQRRAVIVHLDPGLAFGTGGHATTAMCLTWLDGAGLAGERVIDYGCGSGILAIAAAKLGARRVYAHDLDPQALIATRDNAEANAVADQVRVQARAGRLPGACDLLLANILAEPLCALAARFARCVRSDGRLLLSGVLAGQTRAVRAAFAPWFDLQLAARREGWAALSGKRR